VKIYLSFAIAFILITAFLTMAFSPLRLKDFTDEAQLRHFLKYDNTNERLYLRAGSDGVIKFNDQCEDRALRLIENAEKQGWRLHFVPLHRIEYQKWYNDSIGYNRYHAICGAVIGNEFWYIEPSDDRAWRALFLD